MIRRFVVFVGISLLTTMAMPLSVMVDWDRQVDFSRYRTFSWAKGTEAQEFVQKRIVEAVEAALQTEGVERVKDNPDLYVVTHAVLDEQDRLDVAEIGTVGTFAHGGLGTKSINMSELDVGVLVVDIFDAGSKEIVWRGQASATLTGDREKRDKRIGKAVAKMFKKFPPPQKK